MKEFMELITPIVSVVPFEEKEKSVEKTSKSNSQNCETY
jgi:hypothetical protein